MVCDRIPAITLLPQLHFDTRRPLPSFRSTARDDKCTNSTHDRMSGTTKLHCQTVGRPLRYTRMEKYEGPKKEVTPQTYVAQPTPVSIFGLKPHLLPLQPVRPSSSTLSAPVIPDLADERVSADQRCLECVFVQLLLARIGQWQITHSVLDEDFSRTGVTLPCFQSDARGGTNAEAAAVGLMIPNSTCVALHFDSTWNCFTWFAAWAQACGY